VQSRFAHGPSFGVFAFAWAGAAVSVSATASATAAQAMVLDATRRSAAVLVESIDGHLRVRREVNGASAPARHRSFAGAARARSGPYGRSPADEGRTGVRVRL
jgi:hypothetical protein